jgi:hypothetical protein
MINVVTNQKIRLIPIIGGDRLAKGYIKLHRELQGHWLWDKKPFSPGQAWIDLLMMANHESKKFPLGIELVEVERGSLITSEIKLMDRWGWSKTKVRDFLNLLQNDSMLVKKTDHKKTTLTLCNYSDWQDTETTEEPKKDQKKTIKKPKKDTNKNEEECKECKEDIYSSYTSNPDLLKALRDFEDMRISLKNGKFGDQAKKILLTELNKLADTDEKKISILEQSILNNWKGVFPLKSNNQQKLAQQKPVSNFEGRKYDANSLEAQLLARGKRDLG